MVLLKSGASLSSPPAFPFSAEAPNRRGCSTHSHGEYHGQRHLLGNSAGPPAQAGQRCGEGREVAVPCGCPGTLDQIKGSGSWHGAGQRDANAPAEGQVPGKGLNPTDPSSARGTQPVHPFGFRRPRGVGCSVTRLPWYVLERVGSQAEAAK